MSRFDAFLVRICLYLDDDSLVAVRCSALGPGKGRACGEGRP